VPVGIRKEKEDEMENGRTNRRKKIRRRREEEGYGAGRE
jgi:hypothetical protein